MNTQEMTIYEESGVVRVAVINPFSQEVTFVDVGEITQAQLDFWSRFMDDDLREELHAELAPCTPQEFVVAWLERVGPEEAGKIVHGS